MHPGERLAFELGQFAQRLVERIALLFQLLDPHANPLGQRAHLFEMLGVRIVQVEEFGDVGQRKPQPFATQDQLHPGDLAPTIDARRPDAAGLDQPLVFIETQGPRRDAEHLGHLLDTLQLASVLVHPLHPHLKRAGV
ncbi:hypothetical protein WR25_10696 [Diploscapter pachys]|uniref:Uncharacterized protein n=1 Tax=Diploscapter pachys TaxID=2018661 RepID=A0A2A2K5Z6_9BILA|nr:hypothetical protein WR25_10696 [Diploscapter pachys]